VLVEPDELGEGVGVSGPAGGDESLFGSGGVSGRLHRQAERPGRVHRVLVIEIGEIGWVPFNLLDDLGDAPVTRAGEKIPCNRRLTGAL